MSMFSYNNKQYGTVLVEVIVAVSIISIIFIELFGVATRTLSFSYQSLKTSEASFLLEEGAEAVKTIRDDNWTTLSASLLETPYYLSFSSGIWSLTSTETQIGEYTRTVTLHSVYRDTNDDIISSGDGTLDPDIIRIAVSVIWPNGNQTSTKTLSFYIANIFD